MRRILLFLFLLAIGADFAVSEDHFSIGSRKYTLGDNAGAISELEKALTINPKNSAAESLLVIALAEEVMRLYEINDYENAAAHLKRLLKIVPDDPEMNQIAQEIERGLKMQQLTKESSPAAEEELSRLFQESWRYYETAAQEGVDIDRRISILRNLLITLAGSSVPLAELEKEYYLLLWEQDKEKPLPESAKVQMKPVTPNSGSSRMANRYLEQGRKFYSQGNYTEAIKNLNLALQESPGHANAKRLLAEVRLVTGIIFYRDNKISEAIREWEEVVKLDPHQTKAQHYLERAREKLARLKELKNQ